MGPHKYTVNRSDDHDVAPEETLLDGLSGHSMVEIPITRGVFRALYILVGAMILVICIQAFRLQVVHGKKLTQQADRSRLNTYPIPALRGNIFDSQGKTLVENIPIFDVVVARAQLLANSSGDQYLQLNNLIKLPEGGITKIIAANKNNGVFVVARDITKAEAVSLQAARIPGVFIVPFARRHYEQGPALAHVLGYTSLISPEEATLDTDDRYQPNDRVGRAGVESQYEEELHGQPQYIVLEGSTTTQATTAVAGDDVTLYLDADVQQTLYRAVDEVFRSAGVRRGAAVVQDVRTGAVLGMVSMPTFDPNLFEESSDDSTRTRLAQLFADSSKPLFNRAVGGLYAPGSTIKPYYALVGLWEKVVDPAKTIYADGAIYVQSENDPSVVYTYRDWKVHGLTDLRKAIAWSVDVYFYALGGGYKDFRGLGIDRLEKYLRIARADQKTGIDLPGEAIGFVPSQKLKKEKKREPWYIGDTYNVSIGQGDLQLTPIWLSSYVSAIANGGTLYRPMVAKSIKDTASGKITEMKPREVGRLPFDEATYRIVREGMRQTITDGTAQRLNSLPKPVAAKTGTAQVGGQALNSLFIVYGPYDNPEIALTVLVEHIPQSQSLGVMVAEKFFSWYFTKQ
ncbi:MAG: penicillin-binding protein 2 [Patescibacteria group bacterium]